MRLYVLSLGTTVVDKGVLLTPGVDVGTFVPTPVPGYLVESASGERVLIDTGLHPGHITDPDMTWGGVPAMRDVLRPVMAEEHTVEHQLGLLGLGPDDVTHVVSSHLHFDHCGQHFRFPGRPVLVSGAHLDAARDNPAFPARYWDLEGLSYVRTDGEGVLFDGITALSTPGHAPHHCSFAIDLPRTGTVVLAIDAVLTGGQLAADDWTAHPDPDTARESGHRLRAIAEAAAAPLFFGHDPEQWPQLRHAPEFYD